MKTTRFLLVMVTLWAGGQNVTAQENQTLFKNTGIRRSGGYAALSSQFTTINGDFANMASLYGGWFINRTWMIGFGASATTNYIPVPRDFSEFPASRMTYQYGQVGVMTEYTLASTKLIHLNFNLLTGTGFTLQYDRREVDDWNFEGWERHDDRDPNCHFVMEPGVQIEVNLFKWMRFSPGISYRRTFGAHGNGLSDAQLSNISYNLSLKFGKF
jgi:hypothetical protein